MVTLNDFDMYDIWKHYETRQNTNQNSAFVKYSVLQEIDQPFKEAIVRAFLEKISWQKCLTDNETTYKFTKPVTHIYDWRRGLTTMPLSIGPFWKISFNQNCLWVCCSGESLLANDLMATVFNR